MESLSILVFFIIILLMLFYHHASFVVFSAALLVYFMLITLFTDLSWPTLLLGWPLTIIGILILGLPQLRQRLFISSALQKYKKIVPSLSATEKAVLQAGQTGWETELFRGTPTWTTLLKTNVSTLTLEEQSFLDNEVESLLEMIDDWDITHKRLDIPPAIWDFLKEKGFFGLIIPKQFGGKNFSAFAHSEILAKVAGVSATVVSTISVPNALGPAELLLAYGTEKQKNDYLPKLANGREIPCFALTSAQAGSDAAAILDTGIICEDQFQGEQILGIRLNWNKRYITLAPIATLIALAFKLYDPNHLLGDTPSLGITLALIPAHTPGIIRGDRHFPLNIPFQNGPIEGHNVFIPLDWIIGGKRMLGQGWRMLIECLSAGRAISLPSASAGSAKAITLATTAYARIRRQFNTPIGEFEGIQEILARMGGNLYIIEAARSLSVGELDQGCKSAVAAAIVKYHVTEKGRAIITDAMDVHGGKGICMGPHNYIARAYQACPIAVTVEGANIVTRCLMIYGQGAIRCHPYVLAQMRAAHINDQRAALKQFDAALTGHIGFFLSNIVRTAWLGLSRAYFVSVPNVKQLRHYMRQLSRFSAILSFISDFSMLVFGSNLKNKERMSARLGDIFSLLYLSSAVIKRFHDEGEHANDAPLAKWALQDCLFKMQQTTTRLIANFPKRWQRSVLRWLIFPSGYYLCPPSDADEHTIAQCLLKQSDTRARLCKGVYMGNSASNPISQLEEALNEIIAAEPIEKQLKDDMKSQNKSHLPLSEQVELAVKRQLISPVEGEILLAASLARHQAICVDHFSLAELTERSE